MISLLRGRIAEKSLGYVVVDVGGVGYGVSVPLSTYYRLGGKGEEAELKIYTHVRENAIELFGFLTEEERRLFILLIGVSGIGPRVATGILSHVEVCDLVGAIRSGELGRKKIPGVGPKLAARVSTELKDKLGGFESGGSAKREGVIIEDIVSALQNLGYKKAEIDGRINELETIVAREGDLESALRESLRVMRAS
jgi:Holliday junction DNA helicase RuvA